MNSLRVWLIYWLFGHRFSELEVFKLDARRNIDLLDERVRLLERLNRPMTFAYTTKEPTKRKLRVRKRRA